MRLISQHLKLMRNRTHRDTHRLALYVQIDLKSTFELIQIAHKCSSTSLKKSSILINIYVCVYSKLNSNIAICTNPWYDFHSTNRISCLYYPELTLQGFEAPVNSYALRHSQTRSLFIAQIELNSTFELLESVVNAIINAVSLKKLFVINIHYKLN